MLAKDPDDRFQSATELRQAIDAILAQPRPRPAPAPVDKEAEARRLADEAKAFVGAGLLPNATAHVRRLLAIEPEHREAPELARRILAQLQPGRIEADEEAWLRAYLDVVDPEPLEEPTDLTPAAPPVACPAGMVAVAPCEIESVYGGHIATSGFFVDRYPVTNADYAEFVRATRELPPSIWPGTRPPAGLADHPVVDVSLEAARRYAAWKGRRLPTADEWELAVRSPDGRLFPWGDTVDPKRCTCPEGGAATTAPVRRFEGSAAPCGAVDLVGNVWEWTEAGSRPLPPERDSYWVFGGSFLHRHAGARGPARSQVNCRKGYSYSGFRCALDRGGVP